MIDFGLPAELLVSSLGGPLPYTQDGTTETFPIHIYRSLQVVDEETGAGQYLTVASYANSEFPFSEIKDGDTIEKDSRTWKVLRKLSDNGALTIVELA